MQIWLVPFVSENKRKNYLNRLDKVIESNLKEG